MFDSEATAEALDQRLKELGVQSKPYRSLLLDLIDAEEQEYDLPAAKTQALALLKSTYVEMRNQATDVGFSEHFSITLADMATRANLNPGGDRDDLYLYMMKSTAKKGLDSLTDAELAATDVHDVTNVASGTYRFRVYANLTDDGVDHVQAHAAQLAAIAGVVGYKFAKPGARWRRDTMVIYCTTSEATVGVLAWLRGLQTGVVDPTTYFAADVPHFTGPAQGLRGVSSVEDPRASTGGSYSQRMADLVRIAIDAGVDCVIDDANPTTASYVEGIVARLNGFWTDPNAMLGKPKP